MSLVVRMHVYSGRPDPVWSLNEGQTSELRTLASQVDPSLAVPSGGLGYRGFSVIDDEAETSPLLFDSPDSDSETGSFVAGHPDVESFLLQTAGDQVDPELADHVRSVIEGGSGGLLALDAPEAAQCPPCGAAQAPSYNPRYWNNNPTILRSNNCYNYANNKVTNTFAQPGRGSGQVLRSLVCSGSQGVEAAATRDGLRAVSTFQASIPQGWYVAVVIWPQRDYHWYRQDDHGCWSHKPGQTPVRDVDNSGNKIADPRTCNRGPYTDFCTYMVTNNGVTIA